MSKVSNFNKKQLKDFRKTTSLKFLGEEVVLDLNRNGQVHEVHPRVFEKPDLPKPIPLYDFLRGRTEESAIEFLTDYLL